MRVIIFWDIVPRKRSSLKIQRGWININKKLIRLSISAGTEAVSILCFTGDGE